MSEQSAVTAALQARYGAAAVKAAGGVAGGGCVADDEPIGLRLYGAQELAGVPAAAGLASLGCGNPTAVMELRAGETVLDLGSGGGLDVLVSARRVGPTGRAIGLDMTAEMVALARANAASAGAGNTAFLLGRIEDVPLPDDSVDAVISNCVITLSVDKAAVFAEIARVLRPGGRMGVSDLVADAAVPPERRAACPEAEGGAQSLTAEEYRSALADAGLVDVEVRITHEVGAGLHAAVIRARTPAPADPA
jgi:arsenite methyltransferase